jgi:hypothetical protein
MYNKETEEEMGGHMDYMKHMGGCCSKEIKVAALEKKEKILEAELEFIQKMKGLIKKSSSESKKK